MKRELLVMAGVVAVFVAGGVALISSGLLPEERAQDFNAFETVSLQNKNIVIKEPTEGDNTYIYAISDTAKEAWEIAAQDEEVKEILAQIKGSAVTVAAVQPTAVVDAQGNIMHSGSGQVVITSNAQFVDGRPYTSARDYAEIVGSQGESRQRIWDVFVDINKRTVVDITQERERVMVQTLRDGVVFGDVNMYLPENVVAEAGSTIRWLNDSNLPHNVVGTYAAESGDTKIDSGFFRLNESFQHTFAEKGVFEYHCTIHSEEGMKGMITFS